MELFYGTECLLCIYCCLYYYRATRPNKNYFALVAKYCDDYVGLSMHSHNWKTTRPIELTTFLCTMSVAVAQSFSDGVAIYYVLPVFWMTSYFRTLRPMAKLKHDVMFIRNLSGGAVLFRR